MDKSGLQYFPVPACRRETIYLHTGSLRHQRPYLVNYSKRIEAEDYKFLLIWSGVLDTHYSI
jgi:hypothetical protein